MNDQLKFPLECHFRIVAQDIPGIGAALQAALRGINIEVPLQPENKSAQGSYVSFSADIHVESREMLLRIDETLRAVEGVRMVL